MIRREYFETRKNGVALYRTFSDAGFRIRQVETNAIYDEAIDVDGAPYTYEETDEIIETDASAPSDGMLQD